MPHGKNVFKTASDMAMAVVCEYPLSKYVLPYCSFFLCCCEKLQCIYLPSTESDQHNSNVSIAMCFRVYHINALCNVHGRHPLNENK